MDEASDHLFSVRSPCRYKPLDFSKLPDLYVIYSQDPSNSGKIHSNVKERWQKGETLVRDGMQAIAALAQWGR